MALYSIDNLLNQILSQPKWEKQRRYHELTKLWYQIVNNKVAQHTRPVFLRDDVLSIATYSSAWAQDLNLQRRSLIIKINRRIESPLKDLYFSSAKWYQNNPISVDEEDNIKEHPSTIIPESSLNLLPTDNSQEVLEKWLEIIKKRANTWEICPRCHTNCPKGELKRWHICAVCFQRENSCKNSQF
ncbi:DUF721 domain-containing protein [Geminocystis sp. GBBB08]|uniref:DUF721 domain-containing protein n=1 Tax=Geminocystis sp. GBBB08 TaxID=2604140 RepID=UPI0027E3677A|nr:DUF721 domain-containing protein [Geminocystis sp. GBBB08]MBL1211216.1 DUF721 domain-containing protein [Geminocystis sp. GBBB08]